MTVQGELRQVLAQLELVSQVSAVNLDPTAWDTSESIGGNRPSGGINRKDDRQDDWPLKSVEHFHRRVAKARSEYQLGLILKDARVALEAATRQPPPSGEPLVSSPQWKRWVAETGLSLGDVARKCGVSKSYVQKIRRQYRDAA